MEYREKISHFFGLEESFGLDSMILQFCSDPQTKGYLPFVNIDDANESLTRVKKEIWSYPFDVEPTGEIKYSETIVGFRDYERYIFKINIQNSLNQQIIKYLPEIPIIKLSLLGKTDFCFYFICSHEDLFVFSRAFSDWLSEIDLPLTD